MKKTLMILILAIIPTFAMAQKQKRVNEVSISYGVIPINQVIDSFTDIMTYAMLFGNTETRNSYSFGAINVGYGYKVADWFTIGATYSYSNIKKDVYSSSDANEETFLGKEKYNFHAIMPTAKFTWLNLSIVNLYSKIALGFAFVDSKDFKNKKYNDNQVAFQLSPIGLEVGGAFSGFVEAGIGDMGFCQMGARYQF
ncbi:MAG: hypothetical protein IMY73_05350 [Bacteroidetes bacterium]|nr:hypothetical protein [Bacteroidota bacterium]